MGRTLRVLALFDPIEQTQDDVARARERLRDSSDLLRAAKWLDAAAGIDVDVDLTQAEQAD